MKRITFCMAMLLIALTTKVAAQTQQESTATASSTATVITPISLTNNTGIDFGTIAVDGTTGGTVVIDASTGNHSTTGEVTVTADSTPAPATFTVSGQNTYAYTVVVPTTDITLSDGATGSMTLNTITHNATGTIGASPETFNVGGTLNVNAAQTPGTYTNAADLSVTVYYN